MVQLRIVSEYITISSCHTTQQEPGRTGILSVIVALNNCMLDRKFTAEIRSYRLKSCQTTPVESVGRDRV